MCKMLLKIHNLTKKSQGGIVLPLKMHYTDKFDCRKILLPGHFLFTPGFIVKEFNLIILHNICGQ